MPLPRKTLIALLVFVALVMSLRYIPGLQWFRGPGLETIAGIVLRPVVRPANRPSTAPTHTSAPPSGNVVAKRGTVAEQPGACQPGALSIVDRSHSMAIFYEGLLRCERHESGARVRVLHYGDSPVTADSVTADVRDMLQKRFGDGGHGFVLISKPWAWYNHRGVRITGSGWVNEAASQSDRATDRIHGLGGVTSIGSAGAMATLEFADPGHRRLEVHYLSQPRGGDFVVSSNGRALTTLSTDADVREPRFAEILLPEGASSVELSVTRGSVRLFGVWAERDAPGVVYASLGLNGASAQTVLRYFEPKQWEEQIRHQAPDLIVMNYGANESDFPAYIDSTYPEELRLLIDRVKSLAPKSSIILMSPMDRGMRESSGALVTVPALPRIVKIQQRVADEAGVAFFNTYLAMGGEGTMARWYEGRPRLVSADFLHPLPAGAAEVANLFERALMDGYENWKARL